METQTYIVVNKTTSEKVLETKNKSSVSRLVNNCKYDAIIKKT